jgi:RNA polymerase sigma factor (TIGR02999 family)
VSSSGDWGEITRLLQDHRNGDRGAFDSLVPMVYEQLREIARRQLRRLPRGESLDTTSLVHEAYMQLVGETGVDWQDRSHFLAISARAMRRIAVDHARRRSAEKRGGGLAAVTLEPHHALAESQAETVLTVHKVLDELASVNERLVRVVECRYFGGYTEEETAAALGVNSRTVQRDWLRARAWLLAALGEDREERAEGKRPSPGG